MYACDSGTKSLIYGEKQYNIPYQCYTDIGERIRYNPVDQLDTITYPLR